MNDQIAFLYQEIEALRQKSQLKQLTGGDKTYLGLIEKTLLFIKGNLLRQVSFEVANNNMGVISECHLYLDSEVQKYANRMEILLDAKEKQGHTQKIDKRIEKCKAQLDNARQKRDEFSNGYSNISDGFTPEPIGKFLKSIFDLQIAGSDMLSTTRFASNTNDFLMRDAETGEIKLNRGNVLLFLEVFGAHKSENLKKIAQIKELQENGNGLPEDIKMQLESIKDTIPEALRQADTQVFDRFCHYSSLPRFSTLNAEQITDDICYGSEEIIGPTIKHLKIALILDSANNFTRQDLIAMIGEENVVQHQDSIQEQISELTNRSL